MNRPLEKHTTHPAPRHPHPRRRGTLLPLLSALLLAVLLAVALNVAVVCFFASIVRDAVLYLRSTPSPEFWQPGFLRWTAAITLGFILAVSLYKTISLWRGGPAVARFLRFHPVDPATTNPDERRFLEVIDDLARATALPAPAAYVLDNTTAMNVFSAGRSPRDAVIGATRGCLEILSRDELKGVLAHEFSHIRGGDIALNLRLVCLLHGLMAVGMVGGILMGSWSDRSNENDTSQYASARRRNALAEGCATVLFLSALGFILLGIGCIGQNFACRIRDAFSRRREFLADAEAAELTGDPAALARALMKFGGLFEGSHLASWRAEQVSHFFFCDAVSRPHSKDKSTHPPLVERIRRLKPDWDGEFTDITAPEGRRIGFDLPAADPFVKAASAPVEAPLPSVTSEPLPDALAELAQTFTGVKVLFYALAFSPDRTLRRRQLEQLETCLEEPLLELLRARLAAIAPLDPAARLPLLDAAAASLAKIPSPERPAFLENLKLLVATGDPLEPFTLLLYRTALRRLGPAPAAPRAGASFQSVSNHLEIVLSALSHAGAEHFAAAARALAAGEARLAAPGLSLQLLPPERCDLKAFDAALAALARALGAPEKKHLLEACAACAPNGQPVDVFGSLCLRLASEMLG